MKLVKITNFDGEEYLIPVNKITFVKCHGMYIDVVMEGKIKISGVSNKMYPLIKAAMAADGEAVEEK